MISGMLETFAGLLPVLLVIGVGALARRIALIDEAGWRGIDQLAYYILFPSILIVTLARTDFASIPALALAFVLAGAVLAMAGTVMALRPLLMGPLAISGPTFTSLFQGATRWNSFVALALAAAFFGPQGVAMMAVAIVAMVPLLNLLCVLVLSRYARGTVPALPQMLKELAGNPFIWSCAVGITLNLFSLASGLALPPPAITALDLMGRGALAVALISVGAGLDFSRLAGLGRAVWISTALRLLAMPFFGYVLARVAGLSGDARGIAILALAVPTATGAYVLARRMGGDGATMAEIITVQTLLAGLTLPIMLALYA